MRERAGDERPLRFGFVGDAHSGEAIAEGVAGEAKEARGLALVAAGAAP
jgi:hypothetical protein